MYSLAMLIESVGTLSLQFKQVSCTNESVLGFKVIVSDTGGQVFPLSVTLIVIIVQLETAATHTRATTLKRVCVLINFSS